MGQSMETMQGKHKGMAPYCQICQVQFEDPLKYKVIYKGDKKPHLCRRCGRYVCIKCAPKDKKKVIIGYQDKKKHTICNICIKEQEYTESLIESMDLFGVKYLEYISTHQSRIQEKNLDDKNAVELRDSNFKKIKEDYKLENDWVYIDENSQQYEEIQEQQKEDKQNSSNSDEEQDKQEDDKDNNQSNESYLSQHKVHKVGGQYYFNYSVTEYLLVSIAKNKISNLQIKDMVKQVLILINDSYDYLDYSKHSEISFIIPILLGFQGYDIQNTKQIYLYIMSNLLPNVYRKQQEGSQESFIQEEKQMIIESILDLFSKNYKINPQGSQIKTEICGTTKLSENDIQALTQFLEKNVENFIKYLLLNLLDIQCINFIWSKMFKQDSLLPLEQALQCTILLNIGILLNGLHTNLANEEILLSIVRNTKIIDIQSKMYEIEQISQQQMSSISNSTNIKK